jgi:hypothetical protein
MSGFDLRQAQRQRGAAGRDALRKSPHRCGLFLLPTTVMVAPSAAAPSASAKAEADDRAAIASGEVKRLIINVPPRHLKSIVASVALPAYGAGDLSDGIFRAGRPHGFTFEHRE